MAEIYGLYSARDGIVRYVGQTGGACAARFEQHKRGEWWRLSQVEKWLHSEWIHGFPVECMLLKSCNYDVRTKRETEWIGNFPNLLNVRKRSFWGGKPPVIPEIKEYMRRYLCNVGDFRGIRYDRHWDCYQVLLYFGSGGVEWLFGDEADEMMPGWGGNMWFPDRTTALNARDKVRQWRRSLRWLPDIDLGV
jgi:hypothetical protein